ncbi:MAG: GNAT family N-acetyltransferase [Ferruginibacter sp.]
MEDISCHKMVATNIDALHVYLSGLSAETKSRFGPHGYDKESITAFYNSNTGLTGYIAVDSISQKIIAYALSKTGYLWHDLDRLKSYGLQKELDNCCTFAPSVADAWQSRGIGKILFNFILEDIKTHGVKYIILWGGVQATNEKAINFYKKYGFKTLGSFEYNGNNLDMVMEVI